MMQRRSFLLLVAAALAAGCATLPDTREQKIDLAVARASPFFKAFEERSFRTRFLALRPLVPGAPTEAEWLRRYPEFRDELLALIGPRLATFERAARERLRDELQKGFSDAELDAILAAPRLSAWDESAARSALAGMMVAEITPSQQPSRADMMALAQRARAVTSDNEAFARAHQVALDELRMNAVMRKFYGTAGGAATAAAATLVQSLRADPAVAQMLDRWRSIAGTAR